MSDIVFYLLGVFSIVGLLIVAGFIIFRKVDAKRGAGATIVLVLALLGCSIDRLESINLEFIKMFGLEAKLAKLDEATEKAYATIEEVEKSRQEMRLLGETLAMFY